jgi:preprotein translocase subunit YajC
MIDSLLLAEGTQGNPLMTFLPFIAIFMMMYFLLIRPQQRQRKELAARIASLRKGDKVVTAGGIHAAVHHISDRTVTLKLSEGIFVPFEKTSIQTVSKVGSKEDGGDGADVKDETESK